MKDPNDMTEKDEVTVIIKNLLKLDYVLEHDELYNSLNDILDYLNNTDEHKRE